MAGSHGFLDSSPRHCRLLVPPLTLIPDLVVSDPWSEHSLGQKKLGRTI